MKGILKRALKNYVLYRTKNKNKQTNKLLTMLLAIFLLSLSLITKPQMAKQHISTTWATQMLVEPTDCRWLVLTIAWPLSQLQKPK